MYLNKTSNWLESEKDLEFPYLSFEIGTSFEIGVFNGNFFANKELLKSRLKEKLVVRGQKGI